MLAEGCKGGKIGLIRTMTSRRASSSTFTFRATMTTFAPLDARRHARALPMPCEPPVMSTVWGSLVNLCGLQLGGLRTLDLLYP